MFQTLQRKSWLNRNKIQFNGESRWLTIPIIKSNFQVIKDVKINYKIHFIKSHIGMLKQEYRGVIFIYIS